ncbi:MAG: CoA transferase, partial [Dehalococcoidia bacterium]|nr:CoA transferase [Dehalococcoidia bacterium]
MGAAALPLKGIRALDLTRARAGPTCARQLADWGADVIKIELPPRPGGGDGITGERHGFDFQNLHRNKRSLTLNLKAEAGRDIFLRLAKDVDVIVENYRPGVKHRLGIDYDTVREVNPRIVYGSISGFGQSGPYRDRPGVDQIAQGLG